MKRLALLPVLTVLLFLCFAGKAENADRLDASLYDPGFLADKSPLYGHEISHEEVRRLFTVPVLFSKDPEDLYTVYYKTYDLIYDAGYIGRTGDYIEEIVECTKIEELLESKEAAQSVLTSSYVVNGPFRWKTFNDFQADQDLGAFHRELDYFVSSEPVRQETVELDGHPALLCIQRMYDDEGNLSGTLSCILHARNDTVLLVSFITFSGSEGVSMDDLRAVAGLIRYNENRADITAKDGEFTLSTKDRETNIFAGKNKTLVLSFTDPDKAGRKIESVRNSAYVEKHGLVRWTVLDAETKEPVPEVSVDDQNVISVKKGLTDVRKVEVTAESTVFHTKAVLPLTVIPAVTKIAADRDELILYTGSDTPVTVNVRLEPKTVPPVGITWEAMRAGIVKITANDDGTASVSPVAAGKTTILITEPGGKTARLKTRVVPPVERVELTLSGKRIPGGKVAVKAALFPKAAADKRLAWSLDVDESVASISSKGLVTISKQAAAGTVITVTCRALGAPEPVVSTIVLEVGE